MNNLEQYNEMAPTWWSKNSPHRMLGEINPYRFRFFDRYVREWANLAVLDVGCGGGFSAEFMAKRGANVSGIDRAETLLKVAREHAAQSGLKIDYRSGVAEALPYPDASFDIVVCVDVLEHVESVQKTLAEIRRVLKPGGVFLFDTINRTVLSKLIMVGLLERVLRVIPWGTHSWRMFITPAEIEKMLVQSGFVNVETAGLNPSGFSVSKNAPTFAVTKAKPMIYVGKAIAVI